MTYTELTTDIGFKFIVRDNLDGTVTYIPCDEGNIDYVEYLESIK